MLSKAEEFLQNKFVLLHFYNALNKDDVNVCKTSNFITNPFQGCRDYNIARDKAMAEKDQEAATEEEVPEDDIEAEDPNINLASLVDELERAMEISKDSVLPFRAVRLPCVAHKARTKNKSSFSSV